ncbi:hypothetical protein BLNAU_8008 [Blattamonas nauphoetae]|uniref:Rap-GAP domain-containing protein n=1 Tax=Blattamonas nauphoetae TaxID=2049346 RepID=A0ABQ9XZN1_9EUKA|nr:hypothetical protein BLNAU_8008 [Blattamonas nauphoetae]
MWVDRQRRAGYSLKDDEVQLIVNDKGPALIKLFSESIPSLDSSCAKKALSSSDLRDYYSSVLKLTINVPTSELTANLKLFQQFLDGSLSFQSKSDARIGAFRILMVLSRRLKGDFPAAHIHIQKSFNYTPLATTKQERDNIPNLNTDPPFAFCVRTKPSDEAEFSEMLTILMETVTNDLGTFEWWFSLIMDTVLFYIVDRPYPLYKGKPTTSKAVFVDHIPLSVVQALAPACSKWISNSALFPFLFSNDTRVETIINLVILIITNFPLPSSSDPSFRESTAIFDSLLSFVINWVEDSSKTQDKSSFGLQIPIDEQERFFVFLGRNVAKTMSNVNNHYVDLHLQRFRTLFTSLIDCPHKLTVSSKTELFKYWFTGLEALNSSLSPPAPLQRSSSQLPSTVSFTPDEYALLFEAFLRSFVKSSGDDKIAWNTMCTYITQKLSTHTMIVTIWMKILREMTTDMIFSLNSPTPIISEFCFLPSKCHCQKAVISRDASGQIIASGAYRNAPTPSKLDGTWIPFFSSSSSEELSVKWARMLYMFSTPDYMSIESHKIYMMCLATIVDQFISNPTSELFVMSFSIPRVNFIDLNVIPYTHSTRPSTHDSKLMSTHHTQRPPPTIQPSTLFNLIGPLLFAGTSCKQHSFGDGISIGLATIVHLLRSSPALVPQHFVLESMNSLTVPFVSRRSDIIVHILPFLREVLLYSPPFTLPLLPLLSSNITPTALKTMNRMDILNTISAFCTATLAVSSFSHLGSTGLAESSFSWGQTRTNIVSFCQECLPRSTTLTTTQKPAPVTGTLEVQFAALSCLGIVAIDVLHQDTTNTYLLSTVCEPIITILNDLTFTQATNTPITWMELVRLRSVTEVLYSLVYSWTQSATVHHALILKIVTALVQTASKVMTLDGSAEIVEFFVLPLFDLILEWICLLPALLSNHKLIQRFITLLSKCTNHPLNTDSVHSIPSPQHTLSTGEMFHQLLRTHSGAAHSIRPTFADLCSTVSTLDPVIKVRLASTFSLMFLSSSTLEFSVVMGEDDEEERERKKGRTLTFAQNGGILSFAPASAKQLNTLNSTPAAQTAMKSNPFVSPSTSPRATFSQTSPFSSSPSATSLPSSSSTPPINMTVRTPIGKRTWVVNEVLFDQDADVAEERKKLNEGEVFYKQEKERGLREERQDEQDSNSVSSRTITPVPPPSSPDPVQLSQNPFTNPTAKSLLRQSPFKVRASTDQETRDMDAPAQFAEIAQKSPTPALLNESNSPNVDASSLPQQPVYDPQSELFSPDVHPQAQLADVEGGEMGNQKNPLSTIRFLLSQLGIVDSDIRRTWTQLGREITDDNGQPLFDQLMDSLDAISGKKTVDVCVVYVGEVGDWKDGNDEGTMSPQEAAILASNQVSLPFAEFLRAMAWQKKGEWEWENSTTMIKFHVVQIENWAKKEETTTTEPETQKWDRRMRQTASSCQLCVVWDENEVPLSLSFLDHFSFAFRIVPHPSDDAPSLFTITPIPNTAKASEISEKGRKVDFAPTVSVGNTTLPSAVQSMPIVTAMVVPPHLLGVMTRAACVNVVRTTKISVGESPSIDHWIVRLLFILEAIELTKVEKNPSVYYRSLFSLTHNE